MKYQKGQCLIVEKEGFQYIGIISEDFCSAQFTGVNINGAIIAIAEKHLENYKINELSVKLC
jgi:hypothetical protein